MFLPSGLTPAPCEATAIDPAELPANGLESSKALLYARPDNTPICHGNSRPPLIASKRVEETRNVGMHRCKRLCGFAK